MTVAIRSHLQTRIGQVTGDRLYRNSLLLMINMGMGSVLGFAFWTLAARTFPASEIGLVTATASLTTLVNTVGGLGLTNTLVRFLTRRPESSRRLFVDAVLLTQGAGLLVLSLTWLTPLRPAAVQSGHAVLEIVLVYAFMQLALLTMLLDATLLAYHRTGTIVSKSLATGLIKLPLLLVPLSGMDDVARLLGIQVVGLLLGCILALRPLFKHCLRSEVTSHRYALAGIWRFSVGNYLGLLIGALPASLSAIIVLRSLGSASSAYFSISFMILALVNVVAASMGQSLFNEAQHGSAVSSVLRSAGRGVGLLLVPAVVSGIVLAPFLLGVFGADYRESGTPLLRLLLLAALPASGSYLCDAFVNARGDSRGYFFLNLQNTVLVLAAVWWGAQRDLASVGIGWLVGQTAAVLISVVYLNGAKPKASRLDFDRLT